MTQEEQHILYQLNDAQRQAVVYDDGPELVVAGAGSGKTRVLTYKIAWLLEHEQLKPWSVLALTFTNKAANEMKSRIAQLVGEERARYLQMGTFHSVFSHILRAEARHIGFQSGFTIYDETDSRSLIKNIVKQMELDDKKYKPADVHKAISRAKNDLCTAEQYGNDGSRIEKDRQKNIPEVYKIYLTYQQRLHQANAMDFDDLLMLTYELFLTHDEIRQKYASRFEYVLVDEYQDTNFVQQQILWHLTKERQRVCVVGDDYQSIYAFRGAKIDNILNFTSRYENAKVFKLERNYRSSRLIVAAANSLMKHNQRQIEKNVYSENEEGDKLTVLETQSDKREAAVVCREIKRIKAKEHCHWSDFAILYRTNAQSRLFEEQMHSPEMGMANCYRVFGGVSFYQRKEIKDALAYFRLVVNSDDEEAFRRIINYPTRGIGNTTVQKIISTAQQNGISLWETICHPGQYGLSVNRGVLSKLDAFRQLIQSFINKRGAVDALTLGKEILERSGMKADLDADKTPEGEGKRENIDSLTSGIADFVQSQQEQGLDDHELLSDYLSTVSLLTDMDNDYSSSDKMTLMTIHSAKGLEFGTVFIVGMEENIFPSLMPADSQRGLEEERRLLYVAITRAEHHCYLSWAHTRWLFGKMDPYVRKSRFLDDIDPKYLNIRAEDGGTTIRNHGGWNRKPWDDDDYEINKPYTGSHPWGDEYPHYSSRMQNSRPVAGQFMADPQPKITKPHRAEQAVNPFSHSFEQQLRHSGNFRKVTKAMTNGGRTISSLSEKNAVSAHVDPSQNDASNYGIKVGSVILHSRFGKGQVKKIEGSGENCKATIDFEETSTKVLLLRFAKFKVLSI